jgi:hypothetical protein
MHAIAFGKRLLGRVDSVPSQYHVATLFWHFCYLPLIPLGSYLVLEHSMRGMTMTFRGIRIPLSIKSWAIAWLRTLLAFPLVMAVVGLITFPMEGGKYMKGYYFLIAISALILFLMFGLYFVPGIGRASSARRMALANLVSGSGDAKAVRALTFDMHN